MSGRVERVLLFQRRFPDFNRRASAEGQPASHSGVVIASSSVLARTIMGTSSAFRSARRPSACGRSRRWKDAAGAGRAAWHCAREAPAMRLGCGRHRYEAAPLTVATSSAMARRSIVEGAPVPARAAYRAAYRWHRLQCQWLGRVHRVERRVSPTARAVAATDNGRLAPAEGSPGSSSFHRILAGAGGAVFAVRAGCVARWPPADFGRVSRWILLVRSSRRTSSIPLRRAVMR